MDVRIKIQRKRSIYIYKRIQFEKDLERTKNKIQSNSTCLPKTIQVNGKMKVVLLSKENMKKKTKSAQKINFLFTIIAAKTVKTHKKIEKHT